MLRADGALNVDTPLEDVVRHVDYLAGRLGIEHVGLGSDFDGATMPRDLADASMLPNLVTELCRHGYDDTALRKIAHENWLRVLRQTWHI